MAAPIKKFGVHCYLLNACKCGQLSYSARWFTGHGIPVKPASDKLDKDGFRILRIPGLHRPEREKPREAMPERKVMAPREKKMPVNQDWTNVWPTAASFNPSVVPLPIRQGFVDNSGENGGVVPYKYHNKELTKIPNFLHLTPRHIRKHCAAIKKFCTPFPKALKSAEVRGKHFPLTVTTQDYFLAGPSIRDPRARTVTLSFVLDRLELDEHATDKMIKLLGHRYNKETGIVSLVVDSCPLKSQNTDYAYYLLTALYYESWKYEDWEDEITWADLRMYEFDKSAARQKVQQLVNVSPHLQQMPEDRQKQKVEKYAQAVSALHTEGENRQTLNDYKKAVLDLLQAKAAS